jgi:hypothetical protein
MCDPPEIPDDGSGLDYAIGRLQFQGLRPIADDVAQYPEARPTIHETIIMQFFVQQTEVLC